MGIDACKFVLVLIKLFFMSFRWMWHFRSKFIVNFFHINLPCHKTEFCILLERVSIKETLTLSCKMYSKNQIKAINSWNNVQFIACFSVKTIKYAKRLKSLFKILHRHYICMKPQRVLKQIFSFQVLFKVLKNIHPDFMCVVTEMMVYKMRCGM